MSEWTYCNRPIEPQDFDGCVAFVYIITNTVTGRMYIGKKRLSLVRRKKVKGKAKRKVTRTDSGWRDYWGSNKPLLEELKTTDENKYSRQIIRWCRTLSEASYYEAKEHFQRDVLLDSRYYNDWISVRVTRKHMSGVSK